MQHQKYIVQHPTAFRQYVLVEAVQHTVHVPAHLVPAESDQQQKHKSTATREDVVNKTRTEDREKEKEGKVEEGEEEKEEKEGTEAEEEEEEGRWRKRWQRFTHFRSNDTAALASAIASSFLPTRLVHSAFMAVVPPWSGCAFSTLSASLMAFL